MEKEIIFQHEGRQLFGHITKVSHSKAWVIFAHGSGSSRKSSRNNWVARKLNQNGFSTLVIDLLTKGEDEIFQNRFDIPLLSKRLLAATGWLVHCPYYDQTPIAYFGASTGAAAALEACANAPDSIQLFAIISRGGRPDLASEEALGEVFIPTLLIVGSRDDEVIRLNEYAKTYLFDAKLVLIPGATHLFEETGALEEVVNLASNWLESHLGHKESPEAHP
jgi:pimeloyl-ACP methyl ester carboxylesterase